MRKSILMLAFTLCLAHCAFGQCGGQERWAVKDGTDSAAGQVDFSNLQTMTIADLVKMNHPPIPPKGDETTRLVPAETNVVKLQAHLMQWKLETDSDYHLVLTDDTEEFTQGSGKATGHSVIGEIPDPNCLAGSHEEFGADSPFLTIGDGSIGITAARKQIEAQFPNADLSGGWNDAGGTMVEVVGVTFFDPAHGQTGRAPNNLEIHPIVSIKFLDNSGQPGGPDFMAPKSAKGKSAVATKTPSIPVRRAKSRREEHGSGLPENTDSVLVCRFRGWSHSDFPGRKELVRRGGHDRVRMQSRTSGALCKAYGEQGDVSGELLGKKKKLVKFSVCSSGGVSLDGSTVPVGQAPFTHGLEKR